MKVYEQIASYLYAIRRNTSKGVYTDATEHKIEQLERL